MRRHARGWTIIIAIWKPSAIILLKYYAKKVAAAGMSDQVLVGELPFRWETDFHFPWAGGWKRNQEDQTYERDLVVVIPGKNRRRAIIMADHYDTAYMEDVYGYFDKGGGPRIAAAGADDNHSATAAMMLAAPIYLELARQGKLQSDIWLVHLTGEEFPSDCMGARALCQRVVEGSLKIRLNNGRWKNLAKTRVEGVYVMDMIAHNNDREKDVFQIAPGVGRPSMRLAEIAHEANESWNISTADWNRHRDRRDLSRGRRSADGRTMPGAALHLPLSGEVRPPYYRRSALYNTDGQIFSDAGVPVVLFMENYDINRQGYHDTHDTMANIDLDYGAALSGDCHRNGRASGRAEAAVGRFCRKGHYRRSSFRQKKPTVRGDFAARERKERKAGSDAVRQQPICLVHLHQNFFAFVAFFRGCNA